MLIFKLSMALLPFPTHLFQNITETVKEEVGKKKSHEKLHTHFHYSLEQYNDDFVFSPKKT